MTIISPKRRFFLSRLTLRLASLPALSVRSQEITEQHHIWGVGHPQNSRVKGFVLGVAGYLHKAIDLQKTDTKTPSIGKTHRQAVRENFGTNLYLFAINQRLPQPIKPLTLSGALDNLWVRKIKVDCENSERDMKTINAMSTQLERCEPPMLSLET